MNFFLAISAFLICLFWAPVAQAHALSCKNPWNYVYYTEDTAMAKKCKYSFDENCNWKSGAPNCLWQASYKDEKKNETFAEPKKSDEKETEVAKEAPKAAPAQKTTYEPSERSLSDQLTAQEPMKDPQPEKTSIETETEIATALQSNTPPKKPTSPSIEDAKKEAKLAAQKVEELKSTMAEIKMNNENNAILYRSPDADLFSVDSKFKAFQSKLSGSINGTRADAGTDSWKKKKKDGSRGLASLKGKNPGEEGGIDPGASAEASGRSSAEPANSATSDNPWVNYMGQTTKAALIDRLRKNPSLLDSLRDRIAELQSNGDQSGVIELMEEALSEAEKEGLPPLLDNLKPMSIAEAFSMDSAETEAHIRSLLADLDSPSDPQFLPQASLFERVNIAHRRSVLRGSLKRQ